MSSKHAVLVLPGPAGCSPGSSLGSTLFAEGLTASHWPPDMPPTSSTLIPVRPALLAGVDLYLGPARSPPLPLSPSLRLLRLPSTDVRIRLGRDGRRLLTHGGFAACIVACRLLVMAVRFAGYFAGRSASHFQLRPSRHRQSHAPANWLPQSGMHRYRRPPAGQAAEGFFACLLAFRSR